MIRPPIGTRYRISWGDGSSTGVTVTPTGKTVPADEVNVMRDGDGSIVTVGVRRLGNPEVVATVAATLRTAAEWFSGDDRDTMREVADKTERAWDDICPVCEEVDCDEDCPLESLRAAVARGELRRYEPMSETVQQLTAEQVSNLRRQFNERAAQGLGTLLRGAPALPLPPCPSCDAAAKQIDQRMEDPKFDVDETVVRMRWLPCGHRFRAVVDMDAGLVRPGEETSP